MGGESTATAITAIATQSRMTCLSIAHSLGVAVSAAALRPPRNLHQTNNSFTSRSSHNPTATANGSATCNRFIDSRKRRTSVNEQIPDNGGRFLTAPQRNARLTARQHSHRGFRRRRLLLTD